jgi:aryl-alcohol dehydrogenase-like predicted oxidoreductase
MRYRTIGTADHAVEVSTLCLGTMHFGTRTDEATSFAILDRFVEAGGTFVDTANNYNAWIGGYGRDSEDLLSRWLTTRGLRGTVRVATKLGAAKRDPSLELSAANFQGLGAETVLREAHESLRHLGLDRIDVLYGHVDDRDTPLEETVGAFGKLVDEGAVDVLGISNVSLWRVVEARAVAERLGVEPYTVVQQQGSYVFPTPTPVRTNWLSGELLDYAASAGVDGRPPLAVVAYSPLHQGALTRPGKAFYNGTDHSGTPGRVRVLHEVAAELGATPNQVALAWLLGGPVPVVPIVGAGSVAQLDEALGAAELDLDDDVRARLDAA